MSDIFITMSIDEAVSYCYAHEREFIEHTKWLDIDPWNNFYGLINSLRSGDILPADLPDYGMDYSND